MVRRDLIGIEEQLLERYPELAAHHAVAKRAGVQEITAVVGRFDAAGELDAEAFVAQVSSAQRAALEGYAASVRGVLPVEELERWITARGALKLSAYDALLGEVDAPGAASLLDALEAVSDDEAASGDQATLDQMLAAIADRCTCGYAQTRVLPKQTCPFCAEAVAAAWRAEEGRVLARVPELQREVDGLLDSVVERMAELELARDGDTWALVERERGKARRRLARLNRAARKEIFDGMLTTWRELAAAASCDGRPVARSLARGSKRSGLGTARLSAVAQHGSAEVKARMREIVQTR